MRRAYRRLPETEHVDRLLLLFDQQRSGGASFVDAMRTPLAALLCSAGFFYVELVTTAEGKLDDYALASRLSYFPWNSMPDAGSSN